MKKIVTLLITLSTLNLFSQNKIKQDISIQTCNDVRSGYQPISPLPVLVFNYTDTLDVNNKSILEELTDENTRFAVRELNQNVEANYSSFLKAAKKKTNYEVIFDWIKYNSTIVLSVDPSKNVKLLMPSDRYLSLLDKRNNAKKLSSFMDSISTGGNMIKLVIGVGIRVKATVDINKRNVSLSGIMNIGASASEDKLSGSVEIQSLGITGESVTSLIPLPVELSKSSIQNLLINISAIREKIYTLEKTDNEFLKVQTTPRILGYENLSNEKYSKKEIISFIYKALPYIVVNVPKNNKIILTK